MELLIFKDTIIIDPVSKRCDDNNYYSMYLRVKNFDTESNMFVVEDKIGNIMSVSNITSFNKACTVLEFAEEYLRGQAAVAISNYCNANNIIPPKMNTYIDSFRFFIQKAVEVYKNSNKM